MKKIIRTNNLQKALEDYDALKGQAVSYVSVLPLPPNVRNGVYCKQSTTNIEESMVLTVDRLIENYAQETETANHFIIPETYTITYSNDVVKGIEVSGDVAIMYEDEEFTTALATTFNLEDNYIFDVITHVTEMAYYMGDAVNQVLHPVVSFGVIAEVHAKIDRVERELDAKIDSNYNTLDNKIDNEITNLAVNFTTNNLVANVASINNATVTNASVSSLNVAEIIANGSAGTNGQILGKVNGNLEWQDFSTDNFVVNNITVNKNAVADNASVNNLSVANFVANSAVVSNANVNNLTASELSANDITVNNNIVTDNLVANNAFSIKNVDCRVLYTSKATWDNNGWNSIPYRRSSVLRNVYDLGPGGNKNTVATYNFLPSLLVSEKDYYSFFNDFHIYDGILSEPYVGVKETTAPLLSLLVTGPRGNTYLMGQQFLSPNFLITSVDNVLVRGENAGTTASTTVSLTFTNSAVTNSFNVSGDTLFGATSVLGTFMVNSNYDTNMPCGLRMNDVAGITTNVINTYFSGNNLFSDRPSMTDCFFTNPSLIINAPSGYNVLSGVTNLEYTFNNCTNFNQPVTIPNSVTSMQRTFYNCTNFNQPVTIPNNVKILLLAFYNCTKLASSSVPIHISHEITLGDTSNYIYNSLVNGECGITFDPSRILNDA